jgi:hypothetical protein
MGRKISTPLIAIAIILLSSCQKTDAYLAEASPKNENAKKGYLKHKPNAEIRECSILQIIYPVGGDNDMLQFIYNSAGDPVSITRLKGGHTGYPNFAFKYDEENRLSEFIGPYSDNTAAEFWHKYFYDNKDNIVLDSAYIFPRIVNGFPENAYLSQLTFYTYDNKRRIIKDSTVFSNGISALVHTYSYDENGNKIGGTYDDQINVNRTNKIWMFLNRDYSVNNPFKADSYNATGFPTDLNLSLDATPLNFLGNAYYKAQIIYNCDSRLASQ